MEDNASKKLDMFLKWAASIGISDSPSSQCIDPSSSCLGHSLTISHFPDHGGRGFGATRDLTKGELILRVPKSALLSREALMKGGITSLAADLLPSLSLTQVFIVCLLNEVGKGNCSAWYHYLMSLPKQYDLLAGFHDFERKAFQVDDAVWAAEKAVAIALLEWRGAHKLMKELMFKRHLVTFRAWIWAYGTISSRSMHVPWDAAGCLCPVGDLFNYTVPTMEEDTNEILESSTAASPLDNSSNGNTADNLADDELVDGNAADNLADDKFIDGIFSEDFNAYCFYARKNYRKGEQVLTCYGTHTNLEFLQYYGFLLRDNPSDKLFIPLEPSIYSSIPYPKETLYLHQDGKPSFALLSALRSWATPPADRRSIKRLVLSGAPISAANEKAIANFLQNRCRAILSNLPTGIEEDESLLSSIEQMELHLDEAVRDRLESLLASPSLVCQASPDTEAMPVAAAVALFLGKKRTVLRRWKLAVRWRLMFKRALVHCVSYCSQSQSNLSVNS